MKKFVLLFVLVIATFEASFSAEKYVVSSKSDSTKSDINESMAYSIYPFVPALKKALEIIGGEEWTTTGPKQEELLNMLAGVSSEDCKYIFLQTCVSRSANDINKFLAANGFDIKLGQLDPGGIGVASILKIFMTWFSSEQTTINAENDSVYKGVKITDNIHLLNSNKTNAFIVEIEVQEGFSIYLSQIPFFRPTDEQNLLLLANKLSETKEYDNSYVLESVSFPEVEMDCNPDVSWIKGLSAGEYFITQAVMQTKFLLDKRGAKAEAAVAFAISKGMSEKINIILDGPFVAWIEKPGVKLPLFVSWCGYDSWKDN